MNLYDPEAIAFLQSRANLYRQLAERQTDENLAKHYRHLADMYGERFKGHEGDRTLKPHPKWPWRA
jgi:hypothetical protein